MRSRRRSESGFTYVELVLIIVLIIIITSMFVPRYSKQAKLKPEVYATAHALAADFRYTQQLAAGGGLSGNSGEEYWLKFYTTGTATDTWKIYEDGNEAEPIKTVELLSDMRIHSTDTPSMFYFATGTPSLTSGGSVDVYDRYNYYRWRVSIVRKTGKVELTEIR